MNNDRATDFHGAKVALISEHHVLTLLRDDIPSIPFPDMWDFPGGGREGDETPQDCALRELWEEFGLRLSTDDLIYGAHRDGVLEGQVRIWFFGAEVQGFDPAQIRFGNEGQRWEMMRIETYLSHAKAITHLQDGLRGFQEYLGMDNDAKTVCRTPTKGRDGVTRIPTWKYVVVRAAILDAVAQAGGAGLPFAELAEAVRVRLSVDDLAGLGSVRWHVTSVKLNMEVEGELKRKAAKGPQKLVLA